MNKYNPNDNYCEKAASCQSVLSFDEICSKKPNWNAEQINKAREQTLYSCSDKYQMGTIQDNQIYIATTDLQHDQIVKGEHVDAHGGLSGYFSDQATIDACKDTNGVLDNTAYNEAVQISPHREKSIFGTGDATYKPHVDCFEIDREALHNNYDTYDFNAAIAKCEANNHLGAGGGNQGYNPYLSEFIDNGTLKHISQSSYSDKSISNSRNCNDNALINSVIPEEKADKIYSDAYIRAQDCVNNNTPHPSADVSNNGFDKNNAIKLECNTGHATISENQTFNPSDHIPQNNFSESSGTGIGTEIQ